MKIDAMLNCQHNSNHHEEGTIVLETIGDRMTDFLRARGRADRGEAYTQKELFEMLNGVRLGPNGKRYHIGTNRSTLNRILTDKQEPPLNILFAFCEMFETDTEWILRGNVLEPEKVPDRFMTDEANEVGALIDAMSSRSRRLMKLIGENLEEADREQRRKNEDVTRLLESLTHLLSENQRNAVSDILRSLDGGNHTNGKQ